MMVPRVFSNSILLGINGLHTVYSSQRNDAVLNQLLFSALGPEYPPHKYSLSTSHFGQVELVSIMHTDPNGLSAMLARHLTLNSHYIELCRYIEVRIELIALLATRHCLYI